MTEKEREVTTRASSAYGRPLEMVTSFKYLGQVISDTDDDWTEVVTNFAWEKMVWRSMTYIIIREGATPRVSGFFFKDVMQAVLIFRADTWVFTTRMGKALGGFQTKVEIRLTG